MQRPVPLTFATLVVVPENRSALLAVQLVAAAVESNRSAPAAPLYLHGAAGTGKSHLVSALAEQVTRRAPQRVITIVPAAEVAADRWDEWQEDGSFSGWRHSDLVVIEDLQHLPPRQAHALAGAIDGLKARRVPLVITAAAGPRQWDLPERLLSRLAGGLVVGLESLSVSSRLAVLQDKAQRRQLAVSCEVLAWLAGHVGGGRALEGALARLELLARTRRQPLDVATVAGHFREQAEACRPTVERIAERVGSHFRVDLRHLRSERRGRLVLWPRQIGMYLARQLTGLSLKQIGTYFGGRDHSTVIHACRKVEQALASNAGMSGTVRQLYQDLA